MYAPRWLVPSWSGVLEDTPPPLTAGYVPLKETFRRGRGSLAIALQERGLCSALTVDLNMRTAEQ